jgi:hypothetical protein
MHLALKMGKMAKEGFSHAAIEETKYLINTPGTEVRDETKRGVEFPGNKTVKAAIRRHPALLHQNQTSACLSCQYGTAKNPLTRWRWKGTGAPPPVRCREWTPEVTPPLPGMPPAPTSNTSRAQHSLMVNLLARYMYVYTALAREEFFDDDEDTQHDTNFDPDMLTDEG